MKKQEDQYDLTFIAEELHRLFDSIAEVPYSAVPSDRPEVICFARRIEVLTGYIADQILADRQLWINMVHPADRQRVFAAFSRCKNQLTPFEIEYRIIHKDGVLRYVSDRGEPVFNDKGEIAQIDGIITDVSEQEQGEDVRLPEIPKATEP